MSDQEALETAVRNIIRADLDYADGDCDCTHNGQPPPRCGDVFVAVWSRQERESLSRTCLDEVYSVLVTVTLRSRLPFDRLVQLRYKMATRLSAIRALIHKDSLDQRIIRAANTLADYSWTAPDKPAGFFEGLAYEGMEPIMEVDGEWFHAQSQKYAGLAQTVRFGKARRAQALSKMT